MAPNFTAQRKPADQMSAADAADPEQLRAASDVAGLRMEQAMLRYAQGDNGAFRAVYAQLAPRLHGFCVRLCAGRSEADDLLQETLLKLHRSRAAYRPDANPLHWAFAIARCAYIDRVRRRKVRPEVLHTRAGHENENDSGQTAPSEPEAELRAAQLQQAVQAALDLQPEAARTAYILVRLEGVAVADAAAILSASPDATKQRVHRVSLALREQLQRRGLDVQA